MKQSIAGGTLAAALALSIAASCPAVAMAQDPACVMAEDFDDGDPAGWVAVDLTEQTDSYWHLVQYGDRGVMSCSTDQYGEAFGYGNRWAQQGLWAIRGAVPPDGCDLYLELDARYSLEPGWDFVVVQGKKATDPAYTEIGRYTGTEEDFESLLLDVTDLAPDFDLRLSVVSDSAASDADGLFSSVDGAFQMDAARVKAIASDNATCAVFEEAGFDDEGDLGGWTFGALPGLGNLYRLEEHPGCPGYPCDPWPYDYTWVAYDPISGLFPFMPDDTPLGAAETGIDSPLIYLEGDGAATSYTLAFTAYGDLPLFNLVLVGLEISVDGGPFQNSGFVYYFGGDIYVPERMDVTGFLDGASTARLRLYAVDWSHGNYGRYWTGAHSAGPWFDNVRLEVDTTPYWVTCGGTMAPPDAPMSFAPAFTHDGVPADHGDVQIAGEPRCWASNGAGARIDKSDSCMLEGDGDTMTVLDSGGVGTHIEWWVEVTGPCGKDLHPCEVEVVHP